VDQLRTFSPGSPSRRGKMGQRKSGRGAACTVAIRTQWWDSLPKCTRRSTLDEARARVLASRDAASRVHVDAARCGRLQIARTDERGAVAGAFHDAHFRGSSSEAWMRTRGAERVMRTRGPDGALADFAVEWVIGGKRMQDAVTRFDDGRWQVLPVYYQVTQRKWVDYTEAKQGPLAPDHPFYWTNFRRMANRECLDCHTTGLE